MSGKIVLSITLGMLLLLHPAYGDEATGNQSQANGAPEGDPRQLVSMPPQARQLMQQDMLDHLDVLNEIVTFLAGNNLTGAAEIAETRMGKSSMGKHRTTGIGPGRFMPPAMRNLGWGMHESASEFARVAKEGDLKRALSALQKVTASCVACHYSYRTR